MSAPRGATLYSPKLLALAVELASFPLNPASPFEGHARSRSCGSTLTLSTDSAAQISRLGMKVSACAVGQAAAAIFARSAEGATGQTLDEALAAIRLWLEGPGPLPEWPGIEVLEVALAYPGRHEAILLPWRAALDALCNDGGHG